MRLLAWSRSARRTRRNDECTVVSVMPYMLARRGLSSPYLATQRRRSEKCSASPPKTTQRSGSRSACWTSSAASWLNAVGVCDSTVTRSARSSSRNAAGSLAVAPGTTTSVPPCSNAPHISHTDTSNANEWHSDHTSPGPKPYWSSVDVNSRNRFPWETCTPFGRPVVPDVKIT
jgi:hypothetical protein